MLLPFASLALLLLALVSVILWSRVSYVWLEKCARLIVLTLPFERLPSLPLGGATLRFSQLFTLLGFYLLLLLFLKNDSRTLRTKLQPVTWYLLTFLAFAVPSFFAVTDYPRFFVTMVGTLLAFGACWFVVHFVRDLSKLLRELVGVLFVCGLFGIYQVAADFVGFPTTLTLLSETYTKQVFGIARAQGTALEPLYFAGLLFFPLIHSFLTNLLPSAQRPADSRWEKYYARYALGFFSFFAIALFLTYSKAALVLAAGAIGVLLIQATLRRSLGQVWCAFWPLTATLILGSYALFLYFPPALTIASNLFENFVDTLLGASVSSAERSAFFDTGLALLERTPLLGIGSGQYGVLARPYLEFLGASREQYLIVNNVYLEVWLEFGLLSTLTFAAFLFTLLRKGWLSVHRYAFDEAPSPTVVLTLTLSLYLLQWLTFSPIFIMPIFILLGLLGRSLALQDEVLGTK